MIYHRYQQRAQGVFCFSLRERMFIHGESISLELFVSIPLHFGFVYLPTSYSVTYYRSPFSLIGHTRIQWRSLYLEDGTARLPHP